MHVDKVIVDEGSEISLEGGELTSSDIDSVAVEGTLKGDVPVSHVQSGRLSGKTNTDDTDVEYEYVPISQATEGFVAKAREFAIEHFVPLVMGILIIVGVFITNVVRHLNSVLVAIGFAVVVAIFAIGIYVSWKDKKQADERYEYALKIQKSVRDKMKENIPQEANESDNE